MKLSENTLTLLKNFAAINPNLLFKQGSTIDTISEAKNILASATIAENIAEPFGIYDLNEFLAALSLVPDPELVMGEKSLTITSGQTSIEYVYASPEALLTATKQIKMPAADVSLSITADHLTAVKKAASVFGHANLAITGNKGKVTLTILDPKNSSANKYSIVVDENNACTEKFCFVFAIGNLKMLPGDYSVDLSSKLISRFTNTASSVVYYIALEKNSTFGS